MGEHKKKWVGQHVKLTHTITGMNGISALAGTVFHVASFKSGINLVGLPCSHCGHKSRISLNPRQVEFLEIVPTEAS